MDATTALAIYRAEKDKALRERRVSHVQLMAEAQEAFRKMLADAQLARKGGRPKGSTNAASAAPAASVVTTQSVAVSTSKLVFKPTKTAPSKAPEKVTASADVPSKARPAVRKAAAGKVAAPKVEKRPAEKQTAEKQTAEKRRVAAKAKPTTKAPKRAAAASAPARKGSAKKAAAPRKQAAARERKPKSRKRWPDAGSHERKSLEILLGALLVYCPGERALNRRMMRRRTALGSCRLH